MPCSLRPISFIFMQLLAKILLNNMFLSSCLEYPGPAGVINSDLWYNHFGEKLNRIWMWLSYWNERKISVRIEFTINFYWLTPVEYTKYLLRKKVFKKKNKRRPKKIFEVYFMKGISLKEIRILPGNMQSHKEFFFL